MLSFCGGEPSLEVFNKQLAVALSAMVLISQRLDSFILEVFSILVILLFYNVIYNCIKPLNCPTQQNKALYTLSSLLFHRLDLLAFNKVKISLPAEECSAAAWHSYARQQVVVLSFNNRSSSLASEEVCSLLYLGLQ